MRSDADWLRAPQPGIAKTGQEGCWNIGSQRNRPPSGRCRMVLKTTVGPAPIRWIARIHAVVITPPGRTDRFHCPWPDQIAIIDDAVHAARQRNRHFALRAKVLSVQPAAHP
jgi:hypothetical protein